ncbi:MAG: 30S ribosomal protein S20 [Actinomycetota bacterium]
MPRSKSVLKRQRQTETRLARRKAVRSELKTLERKARTASGDSAIADYRALQKGLDQAAAKGAIHPNKAARKKSRLAKQVSKSK